MPFAPYTKTYELYERDATFGAGWRTGSEIMFYASATSQYYLYFKVDAISPDHIFAKAVRPSGSPVVSFNFTSTPPLTKVLNFEAIPSTGSGSPYALAETIYYSVTLDTYNGYNAWKVTFWNLYLLSNLFKYFNFYIVRQTPSNIITFVDGSPLQASDLNTLSKQNAYIAEEADQDFIFNEPVSVAGKFDKIGGVISGNVEINENLDVLSNLVVDGSVSVGAGLNANNTKITNLATPTANADAVTKQYVDTAVANGGGNGNGGNFTLTPDSITSEYLSKVAGSEAVSTATIQALAVNNTKLATDAVSTIKIQNLAVTKDKIESNLNLSNKVAVNSIYNDSGTPLGEFSLASDNQKRPVTTNTIRTGAITTAKLATSAVTISNIAEGAVGTFSLANNGITNQKILNNTIESTKLFTNNNLTYNSDGAVVLPKATIGDLVVEKVGTAGKLKLPSISNLEITGTAQSINTAYPASGLFTSSPYEGMLILKSQVDANNLPNMGVPPYFSIKSVNSIPAITKTVVMHETGNSLPNNTFVQPNAWYPRKLNKLVYSNVNGFELHSDGHFKFPATEFGKWRVDGWSTIQRLTRVNSGHVTAIRGRGIDVYSATLHAPRPANLVMGAYLVDPFTEGSTTNMYLPISGVFEVGTGYNTQSEPFNAQTETFSFSYFHKQSVADSFLFFKRDFTRDYFMPPEYQPSGAGQGLFVIASLTLTKLA